MRFGVVTDQILPWPTLVQRWQYFEALGFDSVWNSDHFIQSSWSEYPNFEAWTVLAGLAARTERIRIGVLVTCNTFRHPSLLAKEAVTVDHISNGRLELGFGAGWFEAEHTMFGIAFPAPGRTGGAVPRGGRDRGPVAAQRRDHVRGAVLPGAAGPLSAAADPSSLGRR